MAPTRRAWISSAPSRQTHDSFRKTKPAKEVRAHQKGSRRRDSTMAFKKLAIGNDHTAIDLKNEIMAYVQEKGIEVINVGTDSPERFNYPISGYKVARMVADGEVDGGILICGTGVGISLAANKVEGIRAVVCSEASLPPAQQHQHRRLRRPRHRRGDRQGHRRRLARCRVRGRPPSGPHRHDRRDPEDPEAGRCRGVDARQLQRTTNTRSAALHEQRGAFLSLSYVFRRRAQRSWPCAR